MIRYLIKNNFKIMFRSAVNILLFVLCPIVVSAVLISAFSSLMESYEPAEEFQVGYRIDKDSSYGEYMNMLKNVGDENGVTFVEYDKGDIEELIHQHELGGFVEFKGDSYKVYEINDRKVEGATLEYMMSAFFNSSLSGDIKDISLNIEKSEYAPAINSTDYYGIIYIVYFGWCAIVCAAGLFSNEKKNRIGENPSLKRFKQRKGVDNFRQIFIVYIQLHLGSTGKCTKLRMGMKVHGKGPVFGIRMKVVEEHPISPVTIALMRESSLNTSRCGHPGQPHGSTGSELLSAPDTAR